MKKFLKWECGATTLLLIIAAFLVGGFLYMEKYEISRKENSAEVLVSGEEQPEILYSQSFDGTIKQGAAAVGNAGYEEPNNVKAPTDIVIPDFSELATEDENGENVFSLSVDDFIDCYNYVYQEMHGTGCLKPKDSDNWVSYDALSPCFGYSSVRARFYKDKDILSQPTISLYPSGKEEIHEIRLTFDDHGFRESMFDRFREFCLCMEKTLMPNLSQSERVNLFNQLCAQASTNFFGDHTVFDDPERPVLKAIYRYDKVGMVSFYGTGNIEICFIPLTQSALDYWQKNGVPVLDWTDRTEQMK